MTKKYFENLNYTLANEDSQLELSILPRSSDSIASVCGSGARVLPLFAAHPHSLLVIDLSRSQLLLCELRVETVSQLSFEEFLDFWEYPHSQDDTDENKRALHRKALFESLSLRDELRGFFTEIFSAVNWKTLLYLGNWESTFISISKLARFALGDSIDSLFSSVTMSEHLIQMSTSFPKFRWEMLIHLLGNSTFFNAMLYRGHFPVKNTPGSHSDYYRSAFANIFSQSPARQNFFLQLLLLGKLQYEEGNPIECHREVFHQIKSGIKNCKIAYTQGNVIEIVGDRNNNTVPPFQFVSMSDVPSYFDARQESRFVQELGKGMAKGGILVNRYYLHVATGHDLNGFRNITNRFTEAIQAEKTQMYKIEVLERELP